MVVEDGDVSVPYSATRRVFGCRQPELGLSDKAQLAVVRAREERARFDAFVLEHREHALGPRDRGRDADAHFAERGWTDEVSIQPRAAELERHGDDRVGGVDEGLLSGSQVAERRTRAAPPRRMRIDGEERERRASRLELERAVEHHDLRELRRGVERGLLRARDEDRDAITGESSRALDRFVAYDARVVVHADHAGKAPRPRAVRVTHERHAQTFTREESRARDRERSLSRSAERRARHAEHGTPRRERTRDARTLAPRAREQRCRRVGHDAPLERALDREPNHDGDNRVSSRVMAHVVLDPHELAEKQLDRDRARTARVRSWLRGSGSLFEHKIERMAPSPLAFLRGAAPLFYEILERVPALADGPPGVGVIVGDLHIENFGAFRPDPGKGRRHKNAEPDAIFDVNDFDDCAIGPWRFDLLRLTTSLILGGRELGANGPEALSLARALLDSYAREVIRPHALPPAPRTVRALLTRASQRDRRALLDARTETFKRSRRFVRGPRYVDLSPALARDAARAFEKYVVAHVGSKHHELYEIRDMAFRIAGTGSLGCLRVAILVRGKGKGGAEWVFDMKEEDAQPSSARLVPKSSLRGAERVERGLRACLAKVPRGLGRTTLRGLPMLVRRLTPQEDKLDLLHFPKGELDALARLLGALVGRAHARGKTKAPARAWSEADRLHIVDSAVRLAGMHEAAYLAFCQRAPDRRR